MKNTENTKTPHKLKAVIYARVSTLTEEQQTSFESQQQAENYGEILKKYNAEITEEVGDRGIYSDEGISGTVIKRRAGFLQMIEDAEAGKFNLILTKSISRFSRNLQVTITTLSRLRELGVRVYFQEENLDSLKAQDQFLMNILATVYEQEAATVKARVKQGFQNLHAQGRPARRSICYGYEIDPATKEIVIKDTEAEVIRAVFNWFVIDGFSYEQIAQELYKRGVSTRRGTRNWTEEKIRNLLMQKKYIGVTIEHDTEGHELEFRDQFPPIVSTLIFEQAQEKFRKRAEAFGGPAISGFKLAGRYALSSKIKCECGRRCTRKTRSTDHHIEGGYPMSDPTHTPGEIAFWECQRQSATDAAPCEIRNAAALSESYINLAVVMSLIEATAESSAFVMRLQEVITKRDEIKGDYARALSEHTKRMEELKRRKEDAKKFFIAGVLSADETGAMIREIQAEIEKEEKKKPEVPEARQNGLKELYEMIIQLIRTNRAEAHKTSSGAFFNTFMNTKELRDKILRSDIIEEITLKAPEDGKKIIRIALITGHTYEWGFKRRSPYMKHGKIWGFPVLGENGELSGEIPELRFKYKTEKITRRRKRPEA